MGLCLLADGSMARADRPSGRQRAGRQIIANFMFATGIENSIPTINDGRTRVDQMETCGHYKHWRTDFDWVEELGISFLRFGPPLHTTFLGPDRYDWEFADLTLGDLRWRGIKAVDQGLGRSALRASSVCLTGPLALVAPVELALDGLSANG